MSHNCITCGRYGCYMVDDEHYCWKCSKSEHECTCKILCKFEFKVKSVVKTVAWGEDATEAKASVVYHIHQGDWTKELKDGIYDISTIRKIKEWDEND